MKSSYVSRQNDYRKAFPTMAGETYDFAIPAGTNSLYLALTLNFSAGKSALRRFVSRVHRRLLRPAKFAMVDVRIGSRTERIKVLLGGFTPDHFCWNDLWSDWFEIFVPVSSSDAHNAQISISLADKDGQLLSGSLFKNKILLAEPVFLQEKKGKNVIYLTLESLSDMDYLLENKLISQQTYDLYQLVFKDFQKVNAVSQVDWTFPSVVSYHTGLLTSQHRMYNSERIKMKLDRLDPRIVSMADLFKKKGYVTFSANLGKLHPDNGFSKGMDVYYKPPPSLGHIEYTGDDKWVIKKLQQFKQNCFLHLHYDRLHAPLYSTTGPWSRVRPQEHPVLDEKNNLKHAERYYDANLQMVLHEVHNVIAYLKLHNMFEDTIIMVTGDHGTDIGEWGAMRQENPFIDSRAKVPYLVNVPSRLSTRNATLRPFFEVCDIFGFELPDYFRYLPQNDKELGKLVYSEAFLKSKDDLYVLNISDDTHAIVLHAYMDMTTFSIKSIEKEVVVSLADKKPIQDAATIVRYKTIRERFIEMNQKFYREFYASKN